MKYFLITLGLFSIQFLFSQKNDTIFYDASWEEANKSSAEYFRTYDPNSSKGIIYVTDYFITGELQMTGSYKSLRFNKEIGKFEWFYKNGEISITCLYDNGKRDGNYKAFYKNSSIESEGDYKKGKKFGTWTYYFESGNISAEIVYKKDKIVAEKYWNEDGSEMKDINMANLKAKYPDGNAAFNTLILNTLEYPKELVNKIEGRVIVTFRINKEGIMEDYKITKSTHEVFTKEAERVFDIISKEKWIPGKGQNRLVNTRFGIPINFKY